MTIWKSSSGITARSRRHNHLTLCPEHRYDPFHDHIAFDFLLRLQSLLRKGHYSRLQLIRGLFAVSEAAVSFISKVPHAFRLLSRLSNASLLMYKQEKQLSIRWSADFFLSEKDSSAVTHHVFRYVLQIHFQRKKCIER